MKKIWGVLIAAALLVPAGFSMAANMTFNTSGIRTLSDGTPIYVIYSHGNGTYTYGSLTANTIKPKITGVSGGDSFCLRNYIWSDQPKTAIFGPYTLGSLPADIFGIAGDPWTLATTSPHWLNGIPNGTWVNVNENWMANWEISTQASSTADCSNTSLDIASGTIIIDDPVVVFADGINSTGFNFWDYFVVFMAHAWPFIVGGVVLVALAIWGVAIVRRTFIR